MKKRVSYERKFCLFRPTFLFLLFLGTEFFFRCPDRRTVAQILQLPVINGDGMRPNENDDNDDDIVGGFDLTNCVGGDNRGAFLKPTDTADLLYWWHVLEEHEMLQYTLAILPKAVAASSTNAPLISSISSAKKSKEQEKNLVEVVASLSSNWEKDNSLKQQSITLHKEKITLQKERMNFDKDSFNQQITLENDRLSLENDRLSVERTRQGMEQLSKIREFEREIEDFEDKLFSIRDGEQQDKKRMLEGRIENLKNKIAMLNRNN